MISLPLIINSAVGRVPDLVQAKRLGWIVNQAVSEETLRSVAQQILCDLKEKSDLLRQRALDTCAEQFLWRSYVPAIRQAYGLDGDSPAHRLWPQTDVA